nr:twin-arginine translocase subunit TatC [Ignavibacteriaceae bacterium]
MTEDNVVSNQNEDEGQEHEMTFMEHLEELRWRIIYIVIGVLVGAICCFIFIDFLVEEVLLLPAINSGAQLQNLKPFGQVFLYFQVAIVGGLIISIPNVFLQIWKFVAPALETHEKKYVLAIVSFSSLCFLTGIVFAYFIMLPLTMDFAAHFGSETIKNEFSIDEYMAIIFSVMLAAGLIFELPMISFFLTKLGILTPDFMRKYRKHAIVAIMFFAALLSPGTDPVSQVVLAVPLFFLYEI